MRKRPGSERVFQYSEASGILRLGRVSGPVARADFKSVGGRSASSVGSTPASSASPLYVGVHYCPVRDQELGVPLQCKGPAARVFRSRLRAAPSEFNINFSEWRTYVKSARRAGC